MLACCIGLAAWIAILLLTLPMRYTSHDWKGVWVGLTSPSWPASPRPPWAAWNQRQVLIVLMNVTGTLLVCDAWFDLALSWGSRGFTMSLITALGVELPLALLLLHQRAAAGPGHHRDHDAAQRGSRGGCRRCGGSRCSRTAWRRRCPPGSGRWPRMAQVPGRDHDAADDLGCHSGRGPLVFRDQTIPEGEPWNSSQYAAYRPLMFSIAYRMTGSVSDAEDIVQEAFLRAAQDPAGQDGRVGSPKAYLATITTRLAIDHLRSARVRRESYVGTWLPEPLVGTGSGAPLGGPDPAELAETSDSLSLAFLVLLESLGPAERAVFLLREVFGYDYGEIAGITGKTEAACRQVFTRARRRVDDGRPRFGTSRAEGEELTTLFPGRDRWRRHEQPARAAGSRRAVLRGQRRQGRDDAR